MQGGQGLQVTQQDLEDTFNPPFKSCVLNGNVASVMCSCNKVNGVPTCADKNLLVDMVRGEWQLNGYIVSDCDSIDVLYSSQHYAATPKNAVVNVIQVGLDLGCGKFLWQYTKSTVKGGNIVDESQIDQALFNTFTTLMRLSWFDGDPARKPYGNLGPSDVCTDEHQELALDAAKQGIVLLKNDGTLPLDADNITSLDVVGPNANVTKVMICNYEGQGNLLQLSDEISQEIEADSLDKKVKLQVVIKGSNSQRLDFFSMSIGLFESCFNTDMGSISGDNPSSNNSFKESVRSEFCPSQGNIEFQKSKELRTIN